MKKALVLILLIHAGLFLLYTVIWAGLADAEKLPGFMLGYLYPYGYTARGLGGSGVAVMMLLQIGVVFSLIYATVIDRGTRVAPRVVAGLFAVGWFLGMHASILTAHLH